VNTLTASAHIEPHTTSRVTVFNPTDDDEGFISLRIGGDCVDVALIARLGTTDALRALARAADEAAGVLDQMAAAMPEGAA
jgi:hypothetical protein